MFFKNTAIGFATDLIPLILNGSKTLTYRLGNKYDFLNIEDEIMVKDSQTGKPFAKVKIIEKYWTIFEELLIDRNGHEVYSSKEEQRKVFEKYYGKNVKDDDRVLVLGFKIIS